MNYQECFVLDGHEYWFGQSSDVNLPIVPHEERETALHIWKACWTQGFSSAIPQRTKNWLEYRYAAADSRAIDRPKRPADGLARLETAIRTFRCPTSEPAAIIIQYPPEEKWQSYEDTWWSELRELWLSYSGKESMFAHARPLRIDFSSTIDEITFNIRISALGRLYQFLNPSETISYLNNNRSYLGLLEAVPSRILAFFEPSDLLTLELMSDPEDRGTSFLRIKVVTDPNRDDALDRLEQFERGCFSTNFIKAPLGICFDIGYR